VEPGPDIASAGALFALIAVSGTGLGSFSEPLTYSIPEHLSGQVARGSIVWAPLRDQLVIGVVLELTGESPDFDTRQLAGHLDDYRLSNGQLNVSSWIARETAVSLGQAAELFFPPALSTRAVEMLMPGHHRPDNDLLTRQQADTLNALEGMRQATPDQLRSRVGKPLTSILPALIKLGAIERRIVVNPYEPKREQERQVRLAVEPAPELKPTRQKALVSYLDIRRRTGRGEGWIDEPTALRASGASRDSLNRLIAHGIVAERRLDRVALEESADLAPTLTPEQANAWREIEQLLDSVDAETLLLRGVTGSGKTELYLRAIGLVLRQGRSAIVLAPEISLATQLVRRVSARFPADATIVHSQQGARERLDAWHALADGERRIAIGPRSALFAPLENIGLVVLDEEHEPAYKQDSTPRYHARSVAERLAAEHGALLILGSATPSIESIANVHSGRYRVARLDQRVNPVRGGGSESLELPPVTIVDLRNELHQGHTSLLSRPLIGAMTRTLERGQQTLLFLNRRGTATVVLCGDCGTSITCPYCEIPHTWHEDRRRLICHRCGYHATPPSRCPTCGGHLQFLGAGTQRVAQVAKMTFPAARVARWDQDSVGKRGAQEALLRQIEQHDVDIIVGTQMIAKGLDLPLVTTVGVIQADSLLQLPDFRSAERAFQLITQVAGRAGRRQRGSEVIVQTYSPAHYAIQAAAHHDVDAFLREELEFRRRQRYPPFARLIRYSVRRNSDDECAAASDELARHIARHARNARVQVELLGPIPAFAYRIGGLYQWQLVVRASADGIEQLLDGLPAPPGWAVDIDPISVL
jgi:primosomal protein N' (replication factor Y)